MGRASWIQTNFNGGEWSPLAYGRVDLQKYANALSLCRRFIPTQQGGLARCPGERFVATVKNSAYAPRLQRFEFSTTQAYVLEIGSGYIRVYFDHGQLQVGTVAAWLTGTVYAIGDLVAQGGVNYYCLVGHTAGTFSTDLALGYWYALTGTIYEVPTAYTADQIWDLDFAQDADTVYIVHPEHPVKKLQRFAATNWKVTNVDLLDGPYQNVNITATTLNPSGTTGSVTVTASSVVGINGGAGFQLTDVGSPLRIKCGSNWLWGLIEGYTDTTHVTWTPRPENGVSYTPAVDTTSWRMGLWSASRGYPSNVAFHQSRLVLAGSPTNPSRVDASRSGEPENFAPTDAGGTVVDSHSWHTTLEAGDVNVIQWMESDEWGLLVGTAGNEWAIAPSSTQQAITPTNINSKVVAPYGSTRVAPVRCGKATLYVQRTKRKLREMFYHFTYNTFQAVDVSLLGEHLTKSGLKQMAVTLAPQQIVWIVRNDGGFVALTYDRDQEVLGWHQHPLGGYSDAGHTVGALAESVEVIPSPDTTRDEVWVVVNRYINGATSRTIGYFAKMWEDGDALEDCVFLDSSAEYRGAPTTTISGLTWLVGETVGILADGAVHPDRVVAADGSLTGGLARSTSVAQIGLRYTSAARTMRPEAGGVKGPSQGKMQRIISTVFRFFQTLGFKLGSDEVGTYPIPFRTSYDPMGGPPGTYSGDRQLPYEASWRLDSSVYFETSDPTPCNITMLVANLETKDE